VFCGILLDMKRYGPGVYDAPVAFSPETCDFVQYVADTADLFDDLLQNPNITEADAMRFMGVGIDRLSRTHEESAKLSTVWSAEKEKIDPNHDPAGFLVWDGTHEPEKMAQTRAERDAVTVQNRSLSRAITYLAIKSFAKFHPDEVPQGEPDEDKQTTLIRAVAQAYSAREPLPLSEAYTAIFNDAVRLKERTSSVDVWAFIIQSLQKERQDMKPEVIEAKRQEINAKAETINSKIFDLWKDFFTENVELDGQWTQVYESLLKNAGLEDFHNHPSALLMNDALRLLVKQQQLSKQVKGTALAYDTPENIIHQAITEEHALIDRAKNTLENSLEFEDRGVAVEMLEDLRPRLKDAVVYLLTNAYMLNKTFRKAGKTNKPHAVVDETFWRNALHGKPRGEFERRRDMYSPAASATYNSVAAGPSETVGEAVAHRRNQQ
jgi:hypothetical protein